MRGLFWTLLLVLLALGSAALAALFRQDPGTVLIQFQGWQLETSLLFGLLAVALFALALWLLLRLWFAPVHIARKLALQQQRRLEREGYLALQEGDWQRAEKFLSRAGKKNQIHYLAAARSAFLQQRDDQAQQYLALVDDSRRYRFSTDLARAEALVQQGRYPEAVDLLNQLRRKRPGHPQILKLLLEAHQQQGNYRAIQDISRTLRKRGILDEGQLEQIEKNLLTADLYAAESPEALQQVWHSLDRKQRQNPALLLAWAQKAIDFGLHEEAEKVLKKAISQHYDPQLVQAWGRLRGPHLSRIIQQAEQWLKDHPEDPELLQALGRLCLSAQLWGKARDYLEAALARKPEPETWRLLGELAEAWHADDVALACYRNALLLQAGEPLRTLPPWPSQPPETSQESARLAHDQHGMPQLEANDEA